MPRALPTLLPADLELRLLRKGVGAMATGRDRCADCGRSPLYGEHLQESINLKRRFIVLYSHCVQLRITLSLNSKTCGYSMSA